MSNNNYTLSLNPNITTQAKKQEIQLENKELITQTKPQTTHTQEAEGKEAEAKIYTQTKATTPNADQSTENGLPHAITEKQETQNPTTSLRGSETTEAIHKEAQANDLTQNAEYQEFIRQKLAQEQKVKEAYLDYTNAFKGSKKTEEGFSIHDYTGKNDLNRWVTNRQKDKENQATIYDYLAKYGEHNAQNLGIKIDKDELNKAKARLSIKYKNIKDLTEDEKKVLAQNESIGSRAIDFFRDEKKVLQERKNKLTTNEIDSNALIEIGKLHNITTSLLDFTKSDKEAKEQKRQFLKEAGNIAKKYGYDTIAYDNKAKDYVLIKDGKKYYTDHEGFFNNFDKVINNNYYDIVGTTALTLATGGTGLAGSLAVKGGQVATTQAIKTAGSTLGKEALKAGALSAALSPIDYVANSKDLNREVNLKEMANYSIGNAAGAAVGTLAIGGAIKGVSKSIDLAKGLKDLKIDDLKNIKVKNILDNEEMAISRKLAKFDKNELNANYENFKRIQSDTIISKDIRQGGMLESFIDKVNQYNPLERFTSKKETQERLLSSIFSNKELSREFAGQLTSEEAQIINKAVTKMGDNFKNLSKEYEQEIIKEYVKSGKTNIDSIPALYKELLSEIDKEAKLNYSKSIKNLHENLNEVDFKDTLLQGYKNITDGAIDSLGIENELTRTLIRETQKLESKPSIALNEAIELRKDINEILRNYEKNSSDLKKYRAEQHLQALKENIDNSIKSALDSKVANTELKQNIDIQNHPQNTKALKETQPQTTQSTQSLRGSETTEAIHKETATNSQITKTQALEILENIKGEPLPPYLSKEEFLNGFNHIVNKENFIKHLEKAPDSTQRLSFLNLVEPTQKRADLELNTINQKGEPTKEFIKAFENENKQKYYVLVTSADNENFLLTGIPTSKIREIKNRINKADIIEARDSGTLSSARSDFIEMPTPSRNNTTNSLTRQEADTLFTEYLNANKQYAQIKEAMKDKFSKAITKGMDKKTLNSSLTTEQWKKRVLDTDWGDSVRGLENTIFKNFNPKMQENTQMLLIFRALERNIHEVSDSTPINFNKILQDIEKLESMQLAPKVYPVLDLFKSYSKAYQFSQDIARAKGLEMMHGGGAMATTLEGRMQVFLTNRLFKKVFAHIPYLGDNNAILKSLSKAIKNLKYPSEITLETLKQLRENDLQRGFKPNAKNNNIALKDIAETTPKTDKELQTAIKGSKDRILTQQAENELESLATNPHLLELENLDKYKTQIKERQDYFFANFDKTRDELAKGEFVAKDYIKEDTELINEISQRLARDAQFTPDLVALHLTRGENNYTFMQDKHGINYIFEIEKTKPTPPKTYDEIKALENAENAELQSYKEQVSKFIEKRQAQPSLRGEAEALHLQEKELDNIKAQKATTQNIKTEPTSKDLLLKITEKNHDLQKIKQRLELQTTPKGKKHYQRELELKEKELQELEIQAGIRSEININNNRAKTKDIQDTEYTLTTKDNEKIILTENEINNMQKTLGLHYIDELKHIENNIAPMLDSKLILDMPKYIKSVDKIKARESEKLKKGMFDYNIAIKDTDNNIYLLTKNEYNDKFYTLKATKENGDYYIKGENDLTLNQIQDKIKSGSEVLESNLKEIESHTKHYKKNEAIPFTKIRETSIQTEKMKEAIKADYVVIKKAHLKPNFESESGLQYRNIKQDEVIKDIANNLNVNKLVNHEGSFQGLPLIQHDGQIISGNHRGQGLLNLNEASRKAYEKAIKERFNIDLKSDEILVRKINENVSNEKILQLAKASNEGLENTLQEAIYTKLSKYEPHIKDLKDLHETSLENIKYEVNTRLKGSPTDIQETNLALLSAQVKDTKDFIQSLNTMQKKNGFEKTFNMLVDNAGNFYQLGKDYKELNISELLNEGVRVLANTQSNTNDTFKKLAQDFTYYLKSSNRKAIQEQRESMGLNKDPFKDFKAQVLGATLKRYTINNINPSEQLHNKIQSFKQIAQEAQGPQLFGEPIKINDTLFINHLYADIADTRTDIGFLLRVADTMQDLENKKITTNEIQDKNIKEFVESLPRQSEKKSHKEFKTIKNLSITP